MAAQMAARGHALNADADNARRLLDEAQDLIGRAAERPEDESPWMYFYDATWFPLQRGMAELHLHQWQTAIDRLTAGLDALPDDYRRDRTWYRICLAHALAGAGESPAALSVALATVPDAAAAGRPMHGTNCTPLRPCCCAAAPGKSRIWLPRCGSTTRRRDGHQAILWKPTSWCLRPQVSAIPSWVPASSPHGNWSVAVSRPRSRHFPRGRSATAETTVLWPFARVGNGKPSEARLVSGVVERLSRATAPGFTIAHRLHRPDQRRRDGVRLSDLPESVHTRLPYGRVDDRSGACAPHHPGICSDGSAATATVQHTGSSLAV
ncbi:hypothetical protein GCM10010420_10730 [Streptomyces glaucosporus]|uniref:Uncharacterized protein n=1 Tax=Streptomyces glaucosporus TaxID=284044 RepID=A0ABP5UW31_9ACTN